MDTSEILTQNERQLGWYNDHPHKAELNFDPETFLIDSLRTVCPQDHEDVIERIIAQYDRARRNQ